MMKVEADLLHGAQMMFTKVVVAGQWTLMKLLQCMWILLLLWVLEMPR
jgi:hypothetical protein